MKKIIIGMVVLVIGVGAIYAFRNSPAEPISQNADIETYIRENISLLSPEKEQLGGKFYVTTIEAHGGVGTVNYEDGHNAYTAEFVYEVDEEGAPRVTSFNVR